MDDATLNLLLQSNAKTLRNLCIIDRNSRRICDDKYFWKQKFEHDNYPIFIDTLPKNNKQWLDEYTLIETYFNEAYDILTVALMSHKAGRFNTSMIEFTIINSIYDNIYDMTYIPDELIDVYEDYIKAKGFEDDDIQLDNINIKIIDNDNFYVTCILYNINAYLPIVLGMDLHYDDTLNVIIKILYDNNRAVYSLMDITDGLNHCKYFMTKEEIEKHNPSKISESCMQRIKERNRLLEYLHSGNTNNIY